MTYALKLIPIRCTNIQIMKSRVTVEAIEKILRRYLLNDRGIKYKKYHDTFLVLDSVQFFSRYY